MKNLQEKKMNLAILIIIWKLQNEIENAIKETSGVSSHSGQIYFLFPVSCEYIHKSLKQATLRERKIFRNAWDI